MKERKVGVAQACDRELDAEPGDPPQRGAGQQGHTQAQRPDTVLSDERKATAPPEEVSQRGEAYAEDQRIRHPV